MPVKIWVLNYKTEDLKSVENISSNLVKLYSSLPSLQYEVVVIHLQDIERVQEREWRELINAFKRNPPEHIAVVHPSVNHHIFFRALLNLDCHAQIILHIFGNFFRNGESWFKLNHLLENKNVDIVAASTSYYHCLENFIGKESLSLLPFPVQPIELLSPFSVEEDYIKILFTGRYHDQKNVTFLLDKLSRAGKTIPKKIKLSLAVSFDDFNPTTLNDKKTLGDQFKKYTQQLESVSNLEVELISYKDFNSLQSIYKQNDIFISLSTFLDEDFGCSVLESLSNGTPCIVSNWGGYKDFVKAFPDHCLAIDISLEGEAFFADIQSLGVKIKELSAMSLSERKTLANKAQQLYSNEHLKIKLEKILAKKNPFSGFKKELHEFASSLSKFESNSIELFKKYYKFFWINE
jgi:glycosyltransferase involved in cell wall biosynthesis